MHPSRTSRILALLSMLCLAACGADAEKPGGGGRGLGGPPMHEAARSGLPGNARGMLIRAQSPCRLTFVVEGLDAGERVYKPRRLAAGESVRLWWEEEMATQGKANTDAPKDAMAQGRTKTIGPQLNFAFEDRAVLSAGYLAFMRPSAPQVAVRDYLPPARPEPLEVGTDLELCTYVVADLDGKKLRVLPGTPRSRIVPALDGLKPPAQIRVLRLLLRLEAAGER